MIYSKEVTFDNYYTKQQDSIILTWNVEDGFKTEVEALLAVHESGQNIEEFSLVKFNKMFYPVSICTISQEIVISKEYIWYKIDAYKGIKKYKRDELKTPPYVIENSRISSAWTATMAKDLRSFDEDIECMVSKKVKMKSYMERNCIIVFGCAMFDTMIPVFKLNCMDDYFADSPSRNRLWAKGICLYNPYNDNAIYKHKGKAYTYKEYCEENDIIYQDYDEKKKIKIEREKKPQKQQICQFITYEQKYFEIIDGVETVKEIEIINALQINNRIISWNRTSKYIRAKGTKIIKIYDDIPEWADNYLISQYKIRKK